MTWKCLIREPYDQDAFEVRVLMRERGDYYSVEYDKRGYSSLLMVKHAMGDKAEPLFRVSGEFAKDFFQAIMDELFRLGYRPAHSEETRLIENQKKHNEDLMNVIMRLTGGPR